MVITQTHRRCGGVGAITLAFATIVAAQSSEPKSSYAERFTFDPATGEFSAQAPPQPGTEQGDLELARQALAQQRPKAARKRLRAWSKTYAAGSDRAAEALFLRGEAEFAARWKRLSVEQIVAVLSKRSVDPVGQRGNSSKVAKTCTRRIGRVYVTRPV